jgi:hypothetical protein
MVIEKRVGDPLYVARLAEPRGKDPATGSIYFRTDNQQTPPPITTLIDLIALRRSKLLLRQAPQPFALHDQQVSSLAKTNLLPYLIFSFPA